MYCIVYRSKAKPSFSQIEILEMLKKARINNERLGITGCLLFYKGKFIQYLEGNQVKVLELFDKIKADKRHEKVELISYGERPYREFDHWDMAYEDFFGENDKIEFLRLVVQSYFEDPSKSSGPNPDSLPFWKEVSNLLDASSAPSAAK